VSEPGFVVGNVREDGWLTLRRAPGRVSPVVERQLEGQRVTVFGRRGAVPGVIAVRSIHLTRGRGTGGGNRWSACWPFVGFLPGMFTRASGVDGLLPR